MTHSLVITTDTDQPNKVNGYVVFPAYGENFPVEGTRESGEWKLRAGISDEYRAKGSSLRAAARRLAKEIGIAEGTVAIGSGIIGQDTRYDVRTGRELPKTSVREIPITIAEYMADEPTEDSREAESKESAIENTPTHVVTFLDGTTEHVTVIENRYELDPSYGSCGYVMVKHGGRVARQIRFGPSGDGYRLETLSEYAMRTEGATDREIADALATLRKGPVESHKTSIREKVAMELHARKLAVMSTAGSYTWWSLSLWEPCDSYDTPSTEEFITADGMIVLVFDVDLYTLNCRVKYANDHDGYESVFNLQPLKYAVKHGYSIQDTDDLAIDSAGESHTWGESQKSATENAVYAINSDATDKIIGHVIATSLEQAWELAQYRGHVAGTFGVYRLDMTIDEAMPLMAAERRAAQEAAYECVVCGNTGATRAFDTTLCDPCRIQVERMKECVDRSPQESVNDDAPTFWYH